MVAATDSTSWPGATPRSARLSTPPCSAPNSVNTSPGETVVMRMFGCVAAISSRKLAVNAFKKCFEAE
eukprot:CAMPEP_0181235992 /NCGR_PEP_ID=MMETSP1096-20121128/37909_1 /TAXON_ID=156174 ORGANISM="Chrysochromulina ericina, Strain CCMP281" /NCGR_SAMPLE_ID=MMETSP1096 /ASSEMBLY_ACC=CAM_ASM_000453 /LENGTH=67 /DNA_ID=CAMNT_0023331085 /DNA_START=271 /DNA_END=474 /DNA_ORIENTATION=-